ncbi:MAG: (4Fe-4S)-binding protein [Prevotellaceae bacterium]|jgi:uncharacterized Fe-S cluster protein YjdI|nr:(4Fe-4S)-binding protein [Prevotellaceae bacterium]
MNTVKQYTNGEVTVIWRPDRCCHSGNCWQGLPRVFNPKRHPWINLTAAATPDIIKQVECCPSSALTYHVVL